MSCRLLYDLSSSDVPHSHPDTVSRLHGDELGPFGIRAVRDLDYTLACALFTIDPRKLILTQIDVGNGTIGSQVGIIDGRDFKVLAKVLSWTGVDIETYTMRLV